MKYMTKIATPMLAAEIMILFIIENSGFNVPTIIVPNTPNQMYEIANIASVMNEKDAVAEFIADTTT